jgi:hypothetical protein
MNDIHFNCQYNDKDKMIVSKGDHICFEVYEGEGSSKTICLDERQAYTLLKALENFIEKSYE